jgi:carbonic anhydrase/acetyltransferase-like protein (isoleucine patch superfamily)
MTIRRFENTEPTIATDTYVDETALVIGDVSIGSESSIWPYSVVRGDVHSIKIGNQTNLQDHCVCHVTHDGPYNPGGFALTIGNRVTIGHRVTLHGCNIGDDCLIGMGATIMDGAVIEPHSLIGAGTLVTPNDVLEGGYLWMGAPARKVRKLNADEIESIHYSAQHYVRLMKRHQAMQT